MSGDGELMLTILASFAQEESRSVSENVKWRIRNNFKKGKAHNMCIYGYDADNGQMTIITEEAGIVSMIFADFLSGMGKTAIAKKLIAMGVQTKCGGTWQESIINKMLRNEKYTGDMLLQKSFLADHISKKKMINNGELPRYYVENSHEAIISKDDFAKVQTELARRAKIYHPSKEMPKTYPFTGKIVCGQCGGTYRRKIGNAGTPYAKAVWICNTFNRMGKTACPSQQIPEHILLEIDCEFEKIYVPEANKIIIVMQDGTEIEKLWEHKSRRESWSNEMKQTARECTLQRQGGTKK